MLKGFIIFLLGIAIGFTQIFYLDLFRGSDYLVFVPTLVALVVVWWGIRLIGESRARQPAYA